MKTAAARETLRLPPRQRRFVEEYCVDLNATQAAIRAGYSPRTAKSQGPTLSNLPTVRAAIDAELDARSRRCHLTADRVLEELAHLAGFQLTDVVEWDAGGNVRMKASADLPKRARVALAEVSETVTTTEHGTTITRRWRAHDKIRALELLCRHLGLLQRDRVPAEPKDDEPEGEGRTVTLSLDLGVRGPGAN